MGRALIIIGKVWVYLVAAIIAVSYLSILYFYGWNTFVETADPTNIVNWGTIALTALPGIGLIEWGKRLHDEKLANKIRQQT